VIYERNGLPMNLRTESGTLGSPLALLAPEQAGRTTRETLLLAFNIFTVPPQTAPWASS
jgi:hypothetical protein